MSTFTLPAAQIVALFMECIFYGIFLVTFGMCIHAVLLRPRERTTADYVMFAVALWMFTFATFDVAFGLIHNLDAFIYYNGSGGAQEEFEDISYWVNVMKTADYVAQTFMGDGMLVYRCFVTYNQNWLVILVPALLWIAGTLCGVFLIKITATLDSSTTMLQDASLTSLAFSVMCLTLAHNILTTSLILYRIWSVYREGSAFLYQATCENRLARAIRILGESAALYTLAAIVTFIADVTGSNAQYGVSDCVVQVIGIVFNLIIIRKEKGRPPRPPIQGAPDQHTTAANDRRSKSKRKSSLLINIQLQTPTERPLNGTNVV